MQYFRTSCRSEAPTAYSGASTTHRHNVSFSSVNVTMPPPHRPHPAQQWHDTTATDRTDSRTSMTAQQTDQRPDHATPSVASLRRILIVDDDVTMVRLLTELLTGEGYAVATATRSLRAYDRAREWQPDLILMDLMMPDLNGLDQMRLLALDDDLKAVPIILVTGRPDALDGIEHQAVLRVVDVVRKPFDITHLLETVKTALHYPGA